MIVKLTAGLAALCLLTGAAFAQAGANADRPARSAPTSPIRRDNSISRPPSRRSPRPRNKDVKAFAGDMVRDHTAVNKQALDLVKKLKVTPEDNDTSKALTKAAADKRAELAKLSGAAFDKAYVANEGRLSQDRQWRARNGARLIPSASNAELKSLLQTGLKIFQGHQQHAEHVASELK